MTTRTPWLPEQHRNKLRQAYWRRLAEDLAAWTERQRLLEQERVRQAYPIEVSHDPTR